MKKVLFLSVVLLTSITASALEFNFLTQALSTPTVQEMLKGYQVTSIQVYRSIRSFNEIPQKAGGIVVCGVKASQNSADKLVHIAVMIPNSYAYGYESSREILQSVGSTKHGLCELNK